MSIADVRAYLDNGFDQVSGWCISQLWQIIQPIAELQEKQGIRCPIAEIGVYHGKFFIGLMRTKGVPGNVAIDAFSLQRFNLDGAGVGNLAKFKENIVACGGRTEDVSCFERDSMAINAHDIEEYRELSGGGFSLFSVDGCHTVEHTTNDTQIAMELTVPGGLIFVDDYTNHRWPGVQEAIAKMYFSGSPRWLPLAVGCNKLILTHMSYHTEHLAAIENNFRVNHADTTVKKVVRFGYDNLTFIPDFKKGKSLST